jgi:nitric oxide dioxygenase
MSILSLKSSFINLDDHIEYPQEGILSKVLLKDENCQYTLFCLAQGTEISEHTSSRNATVNVIEGEGNDQNQNN